MTAHACPCEFVTELRTFSPEWHRAHRDHHLTVFPYVDQGTRQNLAMFVELAEQRHAEDIARMTGSPSPSPWLEVR